LPLRTETVRTQRVKLRTDGPVTPAEARWIAEHRPRTRADCIDGPRPCVFYSCRHHLGVDVFAGGELVFVEGLKDSCSLDVADRVAGVGLGTDEVAVLRGRTRQWSDQLLAFTMIQLRANAMDEPLAARILRANSQACTICTSRGLGWIPLCHRHGVTFASGPDARAALRGKTSLLDALAKFVQKRRKPGHSPVAEDPDDFDPDAD
jgi:hypothetical protein